MSNFTFQVVTAAVLLVHFGTLLWALLRKDVRPVLVLNLCVAMAVWLYFAPQLGRIFSGGDNIPVVALLAFTLATAATSAGALCGLRIPLWLVGLQFAVQVVIGALVAVFAFTFTMRMF
jgi:hypothetical protein